MEESHEASGDVQPPTTNTSSNPNSSMPFRLDTQSIVLLASASAHIDGAANALRTSYGTFAEMEPEELPARTLEEKMRQIQTLTDDLMRLGGWTTAGGNMPDLSNLTMSDGTDSAPNTVVDEDGAETQIPAGDAELDQPQQSASAKKKKNRKRKSKKSKKTAPKDLNAESTETNRQSDGTAQQ